MIHENHGPCGASEIEERARRGTAASRASASGGNRPDRLWDGTAGGTKPKAAAGLMPRKTAVDEQWMRQSVKARAYSRFCLEDDNPMISAIGSKLVCLCSSLHAAAEARSQTGQALR